MSWLFLAALVLGFGALAWPRPAAPVDDDTIVPQRELLIVPVVLPGDAPSPVAEWAADCLEEELGLTVHVAEKPFVVSKMLFDANRSQGDAVALVEAIEHMVTPQLAVLGLLDYDLHSPLRRDLPFALGARKGWAGLISTFRMEDRRKPDNTVERLRKMLIRYGAEVACDARRDSDPQSVLYETLQRPEQLDIMTWP